jgi:hypothetical protein
MLMHGEKESIEKVLEYGQKYGYGNLIGWLKQAWVKLLMADGLSKETAELAADTSPYPQDFKLNKV